MSLPVLYETTEAYFNDCLLFLKTFQWLYNYSNTDILIENVFSNFSADWISYFKNLTNEEFNKLPSNWTAENCPTELKQILSKIESLKPNIVAQILECDYKNRHNSGLSNKKIHEILRLAPHIDNICIENGVDFVIDVGAGLGYLSHLLSCKYNIPVLGIECSAEYVNLAYKNQKKHYPNLQNQVVFENHYIDKNSAEKIAELCNLHFKSTESKSACIVGLHACADLSVTILELFASLDFVKCLMIMPCCYHRMKLKNSENNKDYFEHFPISTKFKEAFNEFEGETFLRRPFLRLACQQTMGHFFKMSEDEHENHSRSLMYRGILQLVAEREHHTVQRLKRKSGLKPSSHLSEIDHFESYLENLKNTHKLQNSEGNLSRDIDESFLKKMREKWSEHKGDCVLAEALTGLQAAIQGVCENLVLLDRVEFLKEQGLRCFVRKVTDDEVSPRCYALVAVKD